MGFYQWLQLVNNFHDLNDILAISWQFLAGFVLCFFGCSFVFFAISWDIQGKFCLFFQFTGQSYRITIIYQAILFPQNIQNANLGILPVYIFIYLCFTPNSLVPVEGIITMIRAIKTDQDFYPEWSPFGSHVVLDIRYITNYSNFRCYISVLGVSMTPIIVF